MPIILDIIDWPILKQISELSGFIMKIIYEISSGIELSGIVFCVITFAILTKFLLLPFTIMQVKGNRLQVFSNLKLIENNKKFQNVTSCNKNKIKLERQIIESTYGYSKTAGCLLAFIQLPIVMAIYGVVNNLERFIPTLSSLSDIELENIYNFFGYDVREKSGFTIMILIPIAVAVVQTLQSWLSNKQRGEKFNISILISSIFSAYISYKLPIIIGIYWIAQSIASIIYEPIITSVYKRKTEEYFIHKALVKKNKDRANRGLPPLSTPIKVPEERTVICE